MLLGLRGVEWNKTSSKSYNMKVYYSVEKLSQEYFNLHWWNRKSLKPQLHVEWRVRKT